jgi:hypothetical protein
MEMGPARALGWTGRVLLIFLFLYLGTSLYSIYSLLTAGCFSLGEPTFKVTKDALTLVIPFSFNNTSYYDINDLNLTTALRDLDGKVLSKDETFIALVAKGSMACGTHGASISLRKLLSGNLTRMLLEDGELLADVSIGFRYALALGFRLVIANISFPWGAPLSHLSLEPESLRFNGTFFILPVRLSFDNHSQFLRVSGRIRIQVINDLGEPFAYGMVDVEAPPQSSFAGTLEAVVWDPSKLTKKGHIHFYLDTELYTLGPVVLSYG